MAHLVDEIMTSGVRACGLEHLYEVGVPLGVHRQTALESADDVAVSAHSEVAGSAVHGPEEIVWQMDCDGHGELRRGHWVLTGDAVVGRDGASGFRH